MCPVPVPVPASAAVAPRRRLDAVRSTLAAAALAMQCLAASLSVAPAFAADISSAVSHGLDAQAAREFRGGRHAAAQRPEASADDTGEAGE